MAQVKYATVEILEALTQKIEFSRVWFSELEADRVVPARYKARCAH